MNGGFFVLEPAVLDYIDGDETLWEREPLERLARDGQLAAYRHRGFWQPMDTLRDKRTLEDLWESGAAPWKTLVMFGGAYRRPAGLRHRPHGVQGVVAELLAHDPRAPRSPGTRSSRRRSRASSRRLGSDGLVRHVVADVRDEERLARELAAARPEVVFHLAAQPIVRESYVAAPGDVRRPTSWAPSTCSRRSGPATPSRRRSWSRATSATATARTGARSWRTTPWAAATPTARARAAPSSSPRPTGELLRRRSRGRGDRARRQRHRRRRLGARPDRAGLRAGARRRDQPVVVRNPDAVRPWQHVLEPLAGYLLLGAALLRDGHACDGRLELRPRRRTTAP